MLTFTQVDVFSTSFMSGNALAVVHDADRLDTETMAAFARWTNLAETTYLLAPATTTGDYRLRIFTPHQELPFAGHPTLGSARAWLEAGGEPRRDGTLVQECHAGLVTIRSDGALLWFAAPPLRRSGPVATEDRRALVAALGLDPGDVVDSQWTDNGPGWVSLLLKDAQAVLALDPRPGGFGDLTSVGVVGPYPPGGEAAFEVRAFVAGAGALGEDPVTGSLNAGLGQWLIEAGHAPRSYVVSQGTRLGRRGRVHVELVDGEVWVGGATTVGIRGEVALPAAG